LTRPRFDPLASAANKLQQLKGAKFIPLLAGGMLLYKNYLL